MLSVALSLAAPSLVFGQSVGGVVVDQVSMDPVDGVLVRAPATNQVTLTDSFGRFSLPGPFSDSTRLELSRMGYQASRFDVESSNNLSILLTRAPVQLDGLETVAGFQSVEEVGTALDRRYAVFRGTTRAVSADVIRQYDERHESDPYSMLTEQLDTRWDFDGVYDIVRIDQVGRVRVEVFIDERQTSVQALIEFPNAQLCHANLYTPIKVLGPVPNLEPPSQIRFYSCSYIARVLGGLEELPRRVCWGDLISGPYSVGGLGGCVTTEVPEWARSIGRR